jgi:uncharacterized protein
VLLTWPQILLINAALLVGSALQGSIGYGMGLVVSPLLLLVNPHLIPGPFILAAFVLMLLMILRERQSVDLLGLRWVLVGGVPGIIFGTIFLASLPQREFNLIFGVILLLAVVMSLGGVRFPMRRPVLMIAGFLSGLMGVLGAIGGPPVALVYQDSSPERMRATISGYFIVTTLFVVAALALAGRFGAEEFQLTAVQLPGIVAGFFVSTWMVKRIGRGSMRPYVLGISAFSGVIVIIKQITG